MSIYKLVEHGDAKAETILSFVDICLTTFYFVCAFGYFGQEAADQLRICFVCQYMHLLVH